MKILEREELDSVKDQMTEVAYDLCCTQDLMIRFNKPVEGTKVYKLLDSE
jgi:hypothetical protein